MMKLSRTIKVLYIGVMSALFLSSCAELRILTYPADFTWIGKESLKTSMHGMANSVSTINSLLKNDMESKQRQTLVVAELNLIEDYALYLSGETEWTISDRESPRSNHLLLSDNMDEFIEVVELARLQAQAEPPVYYGAGRITGGCSSCHRIR